MTSDQLVPVYQSNNVPAAELLRIELEQAGIRCALENELQAGLTGTIGCRLLVMKFDAEKAEAIIHELERNAARHNHHSLTDTENPPNDSP